MPIYRWRKVLVFLCVLSVVISPVSVAAIESRTTEGAATEVKQKTAAKQAEVKTTATQAKCQSLDQLSIKLQAKLNERMAKVDSKRADIAAKAAAGRTERLEDLATKRAQWDEQRQKNFDKLLEKAESDEQKLAVQEYISTIKQAITARRAANDTALATFHSELESLKKTTDQSVKSNISNNSATIIQAIATAKAACQSGQNIEAIKQNLTSTIMVGQMKTKDSRQALVKNQAFLDIVEKKNGAIKANNLAFKEATQQARSHLKASFND